MLLIKSILIGVILIVGLLFTDTPWLHFKRLWLKRKVWLMFGRCPRCNCAVNYTRTQRPICPNCGKPC